MSDLATEPIFGKAFHPAVAGVLRFFEFEHLPEGRIRETAQWYAHRAYWVASRFEPDPELTVALRKLLESKDAAVRCAVLAEKAARGSDAPIVNPSEFAGGNDARTS